MTTLKASQGRKSIVSALLIAALAGCGGDKPEDMVASAKEYLAKQDAKAATIQLRNALQKDPNLAEARYLLGMAHFEAGDFPSAEKELRRALELGVAADKVTPTLAQALLQMGDPAKVLKEFGQASLGAAEAKADLLTTLAAAHASQGKLDVAKRQLAESLQLAPDNAKATLGMARIRIGENDLPGSLELVEKTLGKSPSLHEALTLKAGLLVAQGKIDDAVQVHEEIIRLRPDNVRARFSLVNLLIRTNKLDAASTQLEAMQKSAAKDPQTLYTQALLAHQKKNPTASREAVQQVLKIAPEHLPSLLLAGTVEYELGSYVQAETYLKKVLERAPKHVLARRVLTLTYLRSGQASRAVETIRPALEQAPDSLAILLTAGEAYLYNNELDQAAKLYEKAASIDNKSAVAKTRLAMTRLAHGDTEAGFRELESASALDPNQIQADVTLIAAYLRRNEADKALAAVANLEKKQPKNPLTHNLRATVLLVNKDIPGARKSLERALELQPTYFPAVMTLARLDFQDKKYDAARKRFTDLIEKDPKNPQALLALSQLRLETGGAQQEILDPIERAIGGNPEAVEPRLALIQFHMRNKDMKKALSAAQDAQSALPDKPQILDVLGQLQLASGDFNQAQTTFNKMVQAQPKSPLPLLRLADAAMAAKNSQDAQQALQKAIAIDPGNVEVLRRLVGLHVAAGRFDDALAVARKAQKEAPKSHIGWILDGDVLSAQRKWGEAVGVYRVGQKKFNSVDFVLRQYEALLQDKKNAEAEKLAAEWMKNNPRDVTLRIYLAERATRNQQFDVAVKHYKAVLQLQPENAVVLNNVAWNAGQLKDPEAIKYGEKALALQPNNPVIMDTLGVLLVAMGDATRGLELLQKAVGLAPDLHAIRLNWAKALAGAGRKDEAKRALEPLVKLGDKFPGKDEVAALMKSL